jgi:hypothetical protein
MNYNTQVQFNLYGNGTDIVNTVRLMIFQLNRPAAGLTSGDLFDSGPSTTVDILSMPSFQKRKTFHILYNALIPLNFNGATGNIVKTMDLSFPIKEIRCDYGTTTSAVGQFGVIYFSDSGLAPHPLITMTFGQFYYG